MVPLGLFFPTTENDNDFFPLFRTVQQLSNINLSSDQLAYGFNALVSSFGPTITSGNLLSIDLQELNERRLPYDVLLGTSVHSGSDLIPDQCLTFRGCNSTDRISIIKQLVQTIFDDSINMRIVDVLAHQYKDHRRPNEPDAVAAQLLQLFADSYIVAPLIKTANIQANRGRNNAVFFYLFDYGNSPIGNYSGVDQTRSDPVSLPGDELAYVFGAPLISNLPPFSNRRFNEEQVEMSKKMMTYWSNFVKNGNPNVRTPKANEKWWRSGQANGMPEWPKYSSDGREFLRFAGQNVDGDRRYKAEMMDLWLDLIPRLDADAKNDRGKVKMETPPSPVPPPPVETPPPAPLPGNNKADLSFTTPSAASVDRPTVRIGGSLDSLIVINPNKVEYDTSII